MVVLAASPEVNLQQLQSVEPVLSELAASAGLQYESRQSLSAGDVPPGAKVIFFFSPPANLEELQNSVPDAQFIVLSEQDLSPGARLSVIRSYPEQRAFLAGYIAAMVATDSRSAGLFTADGPGDAVKLDAFLNGGRYYCGICNSVLSPVVRFPLYFTLPNGSDAMAWQEGVNQLNQNIVYLYYVSPEAETPELLNHILSLGGALLGGTPPYQEIRERWVATISFETAEALRQIWPQVISGQGGQVVTAQLALTDINPAYLSQGRLELVKTVIQDLQAGLIYPLSVQ